MIVLLSAMTVVLYVVCSHLRSIVILTNTLIPVSDSIPDIFICEDDSVDECHDGCSMVSSDLRSIVILTDKLIPGPHSVSDIFISEDDSVDKCHDGGVL